MKASLKGLWIFPCLLAALGCPQPQRLPALDLGDPEALLAEIKASARMVQTISGEAKLRLESPKGTVKGKALLALARPNKLRLEIQSFFGSSIVSLASDGQNITMIDITRKTYYTGPATAENLSRWVPGGLEGEEMVTLLLGGIPEFPTTSLEVDTKGERARIIAKDGASGQTQVVTLDPEVRHVAMVELYRGRQGLAWRALLEDYEEVKGHWMPQSVSIGVPQAKAEVGLKYEDVEVNPTIPNSLFTLPPPPGMKKRFLGRPAS